MALFRLPVVKSMIANRLSSDSAAPSKSAQPSSSNGKAEAWIGAMPISTFTRSGASAYTRWIALPPIECPTSAKSFHCRESASSSTSAEISAMVYSPGSSRRSP